MKQLILSALYDPQKYPVYDNYAAIEVSKVEDIPIDYYGLMGVPITALDKHIDILFEILFMSPDMPGLKENLMLNGKEMYRRIIIRRKRVWDKAYQATDEQQ